MLTKTRHLRFLFLQPWLITLFYAIFRKKTLCKMTGYDLQMHLRYRKSISNKETNKILFMHVPVNFARSYTEDERNFPRRNNLILQKMTSSVDKAVNFKAFSRPNKEIKYFSKDFNRIQGLFKTTAKIQDLFQDCMNHATIL